eukprot:8796714-Pyramimonas_sp.AAC.1
MAMRVPPSVINFGVNIGGRHADGVTYIAFLLSVKFENLEEERQLCSGTALLMLASMPITDRPDIGALRDCPLRGLQWWGRRVHDNSYSHLTTECRGANSNLMP